MGVTGLTEIGHKFGALSTTALTTVDFNNALVLLDATTQSTAASPTCWALSSTPSPTAAPGPPRYVHHANLTLTCTTTHQIYIDNGRDIEKEAYIRNGEPADRGLQVECAQKMHSAVAVLNQRIGYVAVKKLCIHSPMDNTGGTRCWCGGQQAMSTTRCCGRRGDMAARSPASAMMATSSCRAWGGQTPFR